MTPHVLLFVGSLLLLAVAGDRFILAVTALSVALRVRPVIVGVLVGGLGTSIPELIVVPLAVGRGEPTLAMGTVIGSIIANVALGLALAALVHPLRVDSTTVRRETPISVAAVLLLAVVAVGGVSRLDGVALLVGAGVALWGTLRNARRAMPSDVLEEEVIGFVEDPSPRVSRHGVRAMLALGGMLVASEGVVRSASRIAEGLGWGEGLVGLTVVALGTSAPLIASGIQAARRREDDVVVGNVLGGNLFIALLGGALVGLLQHGGPVSITPLSIVAMVVVCLLSWFFMARRGAVTRIEAVILIALYVGVVPAVA